MKTVAIIPFFRYEPVYQDNYKILYDYFIKCTRSWGKYVDRIHVISSGCDLELPKDLIGIENMVITHVPPRSHWQNMNEAIKEATEDVVLLLDSDMIIYDPTVIEQSLMRMEYLNLDGQGIFDSSGSKSLVDNPLMAENHYRAERRRFAPYLFFLRKAALRDNFDFTPLSGEEWTDSMGQITYDLLEDKKAIVEMPDDRSTISLEDDGRITSTQWLDDPSKHLWSQVENPPYGYYHVRNFGGALSLVNNRIKNQAEYQKLISTMPRREALRLLGWFQIMCEATGRFEQFSLIQDVVKDYGIVNEFIEYMKKFKEYHSWVEQI